MQQPQGTASDEQHVVVGGERYKAQEDYMRIIMGSVSRIASLSSGNDKYDALAWDLDYITNVMIAMVINIEDKDALFGAKEDILHIELLKRVDDPTKYGTRAELLKSIKETEVIKATISANMAIFGLIIEHNDKYIGIEQKLEVLQA